MTRENIINALVNKGFNAEATTTIKNGVSLEGITIRNESNTAPIIYTESIIEAAEQNGTSLDGVVNQIISIYESHKGESFNIECLSDPAFILENIYIGIQKNSTEEIEKKPTEYDGIEQYLYIRLTNEATTKARAALLDRAGVDTAEAWKAAEKNTNGETTTTSMMKIMFEHMGMPYDESMDDGTMYVVSNECKIKGASAILNKKNLEEIAHRFHSDKIVVLPSSIHECIVVPYTEEMDINEFCEMVRTVNAEQVDPTEQLTDRAYIVNVA